jgi:hypothetical protein
LIIILTILSKLELLVHLACHLLEQNLHLCSTDLGLFAAMIERGDFSCELDNVLTVNFLYYELHLLEAELSSHSADLSSQRFSFTADRHDENDRISARRTCTISMQQLLLLHVLTGVASSVPPSSR